MRGDSSAAEFRSEMDSFGKQTRYGGFQGASGQMFLNTLVKAADHDALAAALRAALSAPADEEESRAKFAAFLAFVEEARVRADATNTSRPSLGFAPYLLSFFWEAEHRDAWPVYYPKSRDVLARHGLFLDNGPLTERYLRYREQILLLCVELNTDTWGVEGLLWHLAQSDKPDPVVNGPEPQPDDLYESYRSQELIFPDEIVS